MDREKFDQIKKCYGDVGSWAVWAEVGDKKKSNIGDLSVLNPAKNQDLLTTLNPEIVLVGLNISRGEIKNFANFHDSYRYGNDYKIRYALKNTPLWGGYMTDIIKDFEEKDSGKVVEALTPKLIRCNIKDFEKEMADIGAKNPKVFAFGDDAYDILFENLGHKYEITKLKHYSDFGSQEEYREDVLEKIVSLLG